MKTYIVILRGINVSGKNKLSMKDLKEILENLDYKEVKTYIQSGNVVLKTEEIGSELAANLKEAVKKEFNYDVPILVRTVNEWKEAIEKNPYKDVLEKQQYFTFLSDVPTQTNIEVNAKDDEFEIINDVVYVNAAGGYGKTKLSNVFFEKKLGVTATTRNLKTTLKLLELAME